MMMMVEPESARERGMSATMSETAAAHVKAVESATRRSPDGGTEFCGVHRTQSGEYGAQIWDGLRRAHVWLGTFGTAEEAAGAFDAAGVKVRGLAVQPSASVTVVKAERGLSAGDCEIAEEHGDSEDAVERRGKKALPDAQTKFANVRNAGTDDMAERAKRKRTSEGDAAAGAKMPRFFEGLTKQVVEQQEAMQHRFMEVIQKREQDRMIREEAWRRQEMARLAREQEILAQERAMAATHNAAVLSYIHKFTGQFIPMPSIAAVPVRFMPPPSSWTHATPMFYAAAPPPSSQQPVTVSTQPQNPPTRSPAAPQPQKSPEPPQPPASTQPQPSPWPQNPPQQQAPVMHESSTDIMTHAATPHDGSGGGGGGTASSPLWSEAEVHALIQLRANLDMRLKGMPLWDEVSAGMRGMGYHRSSQRCMEKWENMNYYFKKMKDINKTCCPSYFHQLEALHRNKAALGSSGYGGGRGAASSSSLWPKAEVQALIQLRTSLGMRGKGSNAPLWEEVSAGMRRMGCSQSSKLYKAKWWQMNYYFDKVKGSKKKRPDDSRTRPFYFHQLEAFHRNKEAVGSPAPAGAGGAANAALQDGVGWSKLDMLWAGISAGEGWSTKECIEKWRQMNHQFKKVNESNKKRPEDSKACPSYFHQLEALCRNKAAIGCPAGPGAGAGAGGAAAEHGNAAPQDRIEAFAIRAPISQTAPQPYTMQPPVAKNGVTNNTSNGHNVAGVSRGTQMQASTGGNVAGNRFILPKLPVRRSTISVKEQVEEFLKGFTDVVA